MGPPKITQKVRDQQARLVGAEWLEPCEKGRDKKAIRCLKCGHVWKAVPANVASGAKAIKSHRAAKNWGRKHGCPKCGKKNQREGVLSTEETRKAEAFAVGAEWIGDPRVNQFEKVAIRCLNCKHEWEATPVNIKDPRRVGVACRKCNGHSRFDRSKPAMVYLAAKKTAVKVGVTGDLERESRLNKFRKQGWTIHGTWHFPFGSDALEAEQEILRWWRQDLKAPRSRIKMYGNGIQETATLSKVSLKETAARIAAMNKSKFGHGASYGLGCRCPACKRGRND